MTAQRSMMQRSQTYKNALPQRSGFFITSPALARGVEDETLLVTIRERTVTCYLIT